MASHVLTASVIGLEAHRVDIETDISQGLGACIIVGLADTAVQEARERVRSALKHTGIVFPRTRITVNLAPADLRKSGSHFDLPIALALIASSRGLDDAAFKKRLIAGELGLDGCLRPIQGALSMAMLAKSAGIKELIIPEANAHEAALVYGVDVYSASSLADVIDHVTEKKSLTKFENNLDDIRETIIYSYDFSMIRGQEQAKRALEIAAAGAHNVLMQGPPGSGKTLLARTFSSILPPLDGDEILEVTQIHSVAGTLPPQGVVLERPCRVPHHSASMPSLIGGGTIPRPGEISLAHRGVLFLDEFLEFPRVLLESLRQPLEDKCVTVSRAGGTALFPANFILIGAMNPCPCGFLTEQDIECTCSPLQVAKYRKRLSGPLLDRMDLAIEVAKVPAKDLTRKEKNESSRIIRERVLQARKLQTERFKTTGIKTNAEMTSQHVRELIRLDETTEAILSRSIDRYKLSARASFHLLKVARTIADLGGAEDLSAEHVAEALQYRLQMA